MALTQQEINIAIGDKAPGRYFEELLEQCSGGKRRYGNITSVAELKENLLAHSIPLELLEREMPYSEFLESRRVAMAQKIRTFFGRVSGVVSTSSGATSE